MARIPQSEIEQLKQTADLVALVEAKGVVLARQGADWVGRWYRRRRGCGTVWARAGLAVRRLTG
jgi:hypothetical protein